MSDRRSAGIGARSPRKALARCAVCAALLLIAAAQAQQKLAPPPLKKVPAPTAAPAQAIRPAAPVTVETPAIRFSGAVATAPVAISIDTAAIRFSGAPAAAPTGALDITTAAIKFAGVAKP